MALWTEEDDAKLRQLYHEGHSCSTIGATMGKTRNAIIGRIHRISLPRRGAAGNRGPRKAPLAHCAPAMAKRGNRFPGTSMPDIPEGAVLIPPAQAGDVPRISFDDLDPPHCRWPCWGHSVPDSDEPAFCGSKRVMGSPYCAHHHARAFAPPLPVRLPRVDNIVQLKQREPA